MIKSVFSFFVGLIVIAFCGLILAAPHKPPQKGAADKDKPKADAPESEKKFVVYDCLGCGQGDTRPLGMLPINCFDDRALRPRGQTGPGNADFLAGKLPNKEKFMEVIRKHAAEKNGPIVMDFEKIFLKDKDTVKKRVKVLATMAQWAKEAAPGRLVGYWGEGGCRLFSEDPGKNMKEVKPIADAVTAFFPMMYTHNEKRDEWKKKLKEVLATAHKIAPDKPVYPFIWSRGIASAEFWTFQLETAKECGADGVVIWGYSRDKKHWNNDAPWWQATLKFMHTLKNPN